LLKIFVTLLKFSVAILIIFWLVHKGYFDVRDLEPLMRPRPISLGLLALFTTMALVGERFRQLLMVQEIFLKRIDALKLTIYGVLFSYVLPGGVSGDLVKGAMLIKSHPAYKTRGVISVLIDRAIGLFTLMFTAVTVLGANWDRTKNSVEAKAIFYGLAMAILLIIVGASLTLVLHSKEFFKKWKRIQVLVDALLAVKAHPRVLLTSFVLTLGSQSVAILFFYFVSDALGAGLASVDYFYLVPVGLIVSVIPIAPAGVGVGQAAFLFLYKMSGSSNPGVGPLAFTALQIGTLMVALIGGGYFYIVDLAHQKGGSADSATK